MNLNRIRLIALLCSAPVFAHAGLDIGINIGVPGVVIQESPPQPLYERVGPPPAPGYIFIHGHWSRHHDRWEWIAGHWDAPRVGMVWVEGHWDHRGGGYVWIDGRWDNVQPQVVVMAPPPPPPPAYGPEVIVTSAPPAPIYERIGPSPGPEYFWISGRWAWQGRWVWVGGHYDRHPHFHPGAVWVDGHWDNRHGNYVWVEGVWR